MRNFALSYVTKVFLIMASVMTFCLGAVFAFQYSRERQFRKELLNAQFTILNQQLLDRFDGGVVNVQMWERSLTIPFEQLHFSIFDSEGTVLYDNFETGPHKKLEKIVISSYPSVKMAQDSPDGKGFSVNNKDDVSGSDYYYFVTLRRGDLIARTGALVEEVELSDFLQLDKTFVWFALLIYVLAISVTYFSVQGVGKTIKRLSRFAQRAEHGEEIYDVEAFPKDELGKIAQNIVILYVRLQRIMKERDQQAQIAMREEQEKAELKRNLTNNINHELKTPVAAISLQLDTLIEHKDRISEEQRDMLLLRCKANSERMLNMVQEILTLNRLDEGGNAIQNEIISLRDIIEDVIENQSLKAEKAGITFNLNLPESMKMMGNAPLLSSIFSNLISNSIAYSGGSEISVLLQMEDNDSYRIIVSDNGIGVPEEHIEKIFDRFYRIDEGRNRAKGGTGIGLAIVKKAVEYHHGDISVRNQTSGGLEFTMTLAKQLPEDSNANTKPSL